ncbi:hypothetical protein Pelo_7935 [Pelomyxa schiedti]|nr:hypothetical protein Pelo_7935 [Pelomyxa schiedti]
MGANITAPSSSEVRSMQSSMDTTTEALREYHKRKQMKELLMSVSVYDLLRDKSIDELCDLTPFAFGEINVKLETSSKLMQGFTELKRQLEMGPSSECMGAEAVISCPVIMDTLSSFLSPKEMVLLSRVSHALHDAMRRWAAALPNAPEGKNWVMCGDKHGANEVKLHGTASFTNEGLLLVDRYAYAEIPAQPFEKSSFTIATWLKFRYFSEYNYILADWAASWVFNTGVAQGRPFCSLRKDFWNTPLGARSRCGYGSDPEQGLIGTCCPNTIPLHKWVHLAFVWNRETATLSTWINGVRSSSETLHNIQDQSALNLQHNDPPHKSWHIGWKADGSDRELNGTMRSLYFTLTPLTQSQVELLMWKS